MLLNQLCSEIDKMSSLSFRVSFNYSIDFKQSQKRFLSETSAFSSNSVIFEL